jgi:hypothetical protein
MYSNRGKNNTNYKYLKTKWAGKYFGSMSGMK